MMGATVAAIETLLSPKLHRIRQPSNGQGVSGGCQRHSKQRRVPCVVPTLQSEWQRGIVRARGVAEHSERDACVSLVECRHCQAETVATQTRQAHGFLQTALVSKRNSQQPLSVADVSRTR